MATDGVKIIDGDSAYDIYAIFEDAYNAGADGNVLREMYKQDKEQFRFSDFEYEICVTVYALALWEVGELTPDILTEVEAVIAKGAGVADWSEEVDEKAGQARQKELDKLLTKISKPNPKIKKRKKYAKIKNLLLNIGDVLTFQMPDKSYGMTVVVDITQYRDECDYMLCRTSFNSSEKPNIDNLDGLRIYGSLVPTGGGMNLEMLGQMDFSAENIQNGELNKLMEEMTTSMVKLKMPFVEVIQHQNLIKKEYILNFELLGNVPLRSNAGSSRYAPDYDSFCNGFYLKDYERRNDQPMSPKIGEFSVGELQQQLYNESKY